jgi:peptidoglycan hydrolase-like protein with peptidoglycan-binding domain
MSEGGPIDIPEDFLDPESDGESQDPDFIKEESGLEATSSTLRSLWSEWMCRKGSGRFADISFYGKKIGGVPAPAADAYRALEAALKSSGYVPTSRWAYNCRKIAGSNSYSLHSAGIAIDIDPKENPFSAGDRYSGKMRERHVAAALAIKNTSGERIWSWGGNWSKPDRMHFQLDQGPDHVTVDWSTVPGGRPSGLPSDTSGRLPDQEENMLGDGAKGQAVVEFQRRLLAWDPAALPRWGADGDYGDETTAAVRRFQEEQGLDPTGRIDGVTAALLPVLPPMG